MYRPGQRRMKGPLPPLEQGLVRTLLDKHCGAGVELTAMMERTARLIGSHASGFPWVLSEGLSFFVRSAVFLAVVGVLLYVSLAAAYPPVHDTMHDFRHALAIVPCH